MTAAGADGDGSDLDGRPIDAAVDAVVARETVEADHDHVRVAMERVADDGVVSHDAAEDELAYVSKVVSTPETRVELARMAFEDARDAATAHDAADSHGELATVRARLDAFEADLATVESGVADLGSDLQAALEVHGNDGDLYEIGRRIVDLDHAAGELQGRADELASDLEAFERWLGDPATRADEFEADLAAIEESIEGLSEVRERVADPDTDFDDPAVRWAEATARHRLLELLLADARAELADLETLAAEHDQKPGDEASDVPDLGTLDARLDTLESRVETVGEDLAAAATPAWCERFADRIAAVEADLAEHEPPVAWGTLQGTIEAHLRAIEPGD